MLRYMLTAMLSVSVCGFSHAHFLFVVPDEKEPTKVVAVFSEDLEVDENIPAERMAGLEMTGVFDGGKQAAIEFKPGKSCMNGYLGLFDPQYAYGSLPLGVRQRGDSDPYLLVYHPKTVFAGSKLGYAPVGDKAVPVELVPVVKGQKVQFRVMVGKQAAKDTEVTVLLPDGNRKKVMTNDDGLTPEFEGLGRYGAWTKHVDEKPGEHDGKKYTEARHYATLVVDTAPAKGGQ